MPVLFVFTFLPPSFCRCLERRWPHKRISDLKEEPKLLFAKSALYCHKLSKCCKTKRAFELLPKDETGHPENSQSLCAEWILSKGAQKQPVVRLNMFRSYLSADDNRSAILDYRGQHLGITLVEHSILVALGP